LELPVLLTFLSLLIFVEYEVNSRVTRLGEFSPLGRLFILGSYFENLKKYRCIGLLLASLCLNFDKNGYQLGDFLKAHLVTLVNKLMHPSLSFLKGHQTMVQPVFNCRHVT
jgi:hypothetical protein